MAEKKKRGREPGFKMTEEHRSKIRNSQILNRLIGCAEGSNDMNSTQVTAAISLLDRVMPKLSSTTVEGGEQPLNVVVKVGGSDA